MLWQQMAGRFVSIHDNACIYSDYLSSCVFPPESLFSIESEGQASRTSGESGDDGAELPGMVEIFT